MILVTGQVIKFKYNDDVKYGTIDVVNTETVWVNQINYKGGYVCQIKDIINNYGIMTHLEFRDKFPECSI